MNKDTQVVTVDGEFDGLVVGGNYYEKGEARHSKSAAAFGETTSRDMRVNYFTN